MLAEQLVSDRTGIVRRVEMFAKDPSEPAIPYVTRADVANHLFLSAADADASVCSGKGVSPIAARVSALGEAVERYSAAVHDRTEVSHARRSELTEPALDPRDLVLYDQRQYATLPYAPYDDNRLGWVRARSLMTDEEVLVPALAVFMNYHAAHDAEFLFPITSNGLATGRTLSSAVAAAAIEVLERDAFIIAWVNALPARRFAAGDHPDREVAAIAATYARRGVEIRLYRLPTDHSVAVFAAIALESPGRGGPAAVVGLGADSDPVTASRKAVLEVCQVRPSLRRRMRQPEARERLQALVRDPTLVATIDDHDLLYASPDALPRLAFWLDRVPEPFPWEAQPPCSDAEDPLAFLAELARLGHDVLYVNLTPPDMAELGLYTARAILPGFQPIDFGWKERRLGGRRLYTMPERLGRRGAHATWDDLNHDPHPLA